LTTVEFVEQPVTTASSNVPRTRALDEKRNMDRRLSKQVFWVFISDREVLTTVHGLFWPRQRKNGWAAAEKEAVHETVNESLTLEQTPAPLIPYLDPIAPKADNRIHTFF